MSTSEEKAVLDTKVQQAVQAALQEANRHRHEFATLEHLCWGLLHDKQVTASLQEAGIDASSIRRQLNAFLQCNVEIVPKNRSFETLPSAGMQRVLQRAAVHVLGTGRKTIGSTNVLVSLFAEADCYAVYLLRQAGLSHLDVAGFPQSHTQKRRQIADSENADSSPQTHARKTATRRGDTDEFLARYTVDLLAQAQRGQLQECIGRQQHIDRALHILARRTKNNPLFVGEAGVGKTALIQGLAVCVAKGQVPTALQKLQLFALDMAALLAGSRYRGDFEGRLHRLLQTLARQENCVLVLDEMHTLVGAGATAGSSMDASSLLKPALADGAIRFIGATTHQSHANHLEKDRALLRRFQKINVHEPDLQECLHILEGTVPHYETFHGVRISPKAQQWAIQLANHYLPDRCLPDKAIDLIDETAAMIKITSDTKEKKGKRTIRKLDLEETVAKMAQVPCQRLSTGHKKTLRNLSTQLRRVIFGQNEAIERLSNTIKMARAGLRPPEKPVGCFLFTGPTGCGKTELAKQLAVCLDIAFTRFDMSEYMESHSVSRLIGAPPGYVGFDQGGLLTDAITKQPHVVLLLDEVEKAHPDILNTLLQIMDYGKLTSAHGRAVDFRHVVLIMTSNAGTRQLDKPPVGFASSVTTATDTSALKRVFSPEFRNRLDACIAFSSLSSHVMGQIADKFIDQLSQQLQAKDIKLRVTQDARNHLACHGYDPNMGARPLGRLIEEKIKHPIANELLFGKLKSGGEVQVDLQKQENTAHLFIEIF
ncbi:MAG: AAA family ATPase [Myxococcota bacterium]